MVRVRTIPYVEARLLGGRVGTTVGEADGREQLDLAHDELRRANHELEAFAAVVSHDLKSPLQVVSGFLELLQARSANDLDETARSYIDEARRAAARMDDLIDGLLTHARAGSGGIAHERVDLHPIVADALSDSVGSTPVLDPTIEVGPLPSVEGNAPMLRQLFANLIGNALKFRRPDRVPCVVIDALDDERHCVVRVTDNGMGVPSEQRHAVFAMFTRLDHGREVAGAGIGLAICERIVADHGGSIWIADGIDGGAQVCFTLPT